MRPDEAKISPEDRVRIQVRGYRMFVLTHQDGTQEFVRVHDDSTIVEHATRPDRWSSWSAPRYFVEITT